MSQTQNLFELKVGDDSETTITCPSVASVATGIHEAGDIVTVTGTALDLRRLVTKQENPWATFALTDGRTGIVVDIPPRLFEAIGDTDTITGIPVPRDDVEWESWTLPDPCLTVTGQINTLHLVPKLTATELAVEVA